MLYIGIPHCPLRSTARPIMKKILLFLRDVVELYIPVVAFMTMFIAFIVQVFFRYVVRHPLTWTNEVIVIGFVWTVILGACYTMRRRSHVKFTLLYDKLGPKAASWSRMLGNILIAGTFAALIIPSYRYSLFMSFEKTAVFRLPLTPVFIPFVYFLCSITVYTVTEIVEDVRVLSGRLPDSKDHSEREVAS
jgi:TRAP-type C4-dicarboxylate transport system permease small subunit